MVLFPGCFEFFRQEYSRKVWFSVIEINAQRICFIKVLFKFDNDEVTDVCIKFNRCNKTATCKCYETVTIDFLPVFIKAILFHHVGLLWMIKTKAIYTLSMGKTIYQNLHDSIFEELFCPFHQDRYDPICGLCVYDNKIISQLMQHNFAVEDPY